MGEEREKAALLVNEFGCYALYSIKHLNINRDCADLNTQQRDSVPEALFSIEILIFRAYTRFIHFCGSNLFFSTCQLHSVSEGRIFLQERREDAESQCPYLAGHITAVKGQLPTSLTHLPLSIPYWS